jgi:murein DD-endopeptidase MepM/ murein hydrolase activator NlpD
MNAFERERSYGKLILIIAAVVVVVASVVTAAVFLTRDKPGPITPKYRGPTTLTEHDTLYFTVEPHGPELPYDVKNGEILKNDTFGASMARLGYDPVFVETLSDLLRGTFSFSKCRPGDTYEVMTEKDGTLLKFAYQASPVDVYVVERAEGGRYDAYREEFQEEMRVEWVTGRIDNSLYEAVIAAGEDPSLAMQMANEVFAWDIDFYTEAQKGDFFKVAVEKYYSGDYLIRYGRIMAAEYNGQVGKKQVFFWKDPTGKDGYYSALGVAARRVFLRSPLKYAHVSSSFGRRFHPILRRAKMHNGVDYAAAIGTPVWCVCDGTVMASGYRGGLGNAVTIKHTGGYVSTYGHLSRITAGVRSGAHVKQGTVIGNVGSTGMSTGPHLHFALQQNGKFINPQKKVAPPTEPIPARFMAAFKDSIKSWVSKLDDVKVPEIRVAPAVTGPESPARAGEGG